MNRRLTLLTVVGAVLVLGIVTVVFLRGRESKAPTSVTPTTGVAPVEVVVELPNATPLQASIPFTQGMTALDALSGLGISYTTKDYKNLGTLVESINGVTNNTDGKYWFYYVQGVSPAVGADKYELSAGDNETWKFETPK